jgi:hypothetical protein
MSAQIQILSNTVWINHNGVEIGLPKEVIMQAHEVLVKKEGSYDGIGLGSTYMKIRNCPNCGLVAMYTSTCGYCGSKCE